MKTYIHKDIFKTELGFELPELQIAYHTLGNLNENKDNVIWICHALTANSNPEEWWPEMVGQGRCFDTDKYFIVCANILGSCYGTTGPLSINPKTQEPYYLDFPLITVRDMVQAHELLRIQLEIKKIKMVIGGSIGGFQSLEWAILRPEIFDNQILIACSAKSSPWVIAFNESQRLALKADASFGLKHEKAGEAGLKAARSIALISYRNSFAYNSTQAEDNENVTDHYKASSYQAYQGEKLIRRFNAYSYYYLSKSVDSHNIARNRGTLEEVLQSIRVKTTIIGITSDQLFPIHEQKFMAEHIPGSEFHEMDSPYGHDGFLIEYQQLTRIINQILKLKK
jgi:homoserine O-acetyltransferase